MEYNKKLLPQDFLTSLEQLDYNTLVLFLYPILSYSTIKIMDNYTLHKDYKQKSIKKVKMPPELKLEFEDINIENVCKKLRKSVLRFSLFLISKFPKESLVNFYNNINTLKIKNNNFKLINFITRENVAGLYLNKKNIIKVNDNNLSNTIYHELFHMASSTFKGNIIYSGFRQHSSNLNCTTIGIGLNEGYTELLTNRYFANEFDCSIGYEYAAKIAEMVEKIVGKDKMENLYLTSNLYGLIKELNKYSNSFEIMKFISDTDFVLKHLDDRKYKLFEKKMILNSMKNIRNFLIKTYSKMLSFQYHNKEINYETFSSMLLDFVADFPGRVTIKKHVFDVYDKDEIKILLNDFLENYKLDTTIDKVRTIK